MRLLLLLIFVLPDVFALEHKEDALHGLKQDQALIGRLQRAQLPRLAYKMWQKVDQDRKKLSSEDLYEHNVHELQFLMASLRNKGDGQDQWQRCQELLKELRAVRGISFKRQIECALMQYEVIEYAYQRDPKNTVLKELDFVATQLDRMYNKQEQEVELLSQNRNRAQYQEQMQLLYRLRYARAWLFYYQATLNKNSERHREYWLRARNEMEQFLSQPITSIPFVRAVIAVCRAELQLDERDEALYLLDDVEADIDVMPTDHARMIWLEHLAVVETAAEKDELYKRIDAYLDGGQVVSQPLNQLRFHLIKHMLGGTRVRANDLSVALSRKYIDELFTSGSELADQCIPYVVRLSLISDDESNHAIAALADAELLFKQRKYREAIPRYEAALQERSLRLNIRLYNLVSLNLAICQRRVQQYEASMRTCLGILKNPSVKHLHKLSLQLFIMVAQESVYQDVTIFKQVGPEFNQHLSKELCSVNGEKLLYFGLSLYDVSLGKEAEEILRTLKRFSVLTDEVKTVSSIMPILMKKKPALNDLKKCIDTLLTSFEHVSDRSLRFLALRLLAISGNNLEISEHKRRLVAQLRAYKKMTAKDFRRMDYLLALQYLRAGTLQAHTELLSRILKTMPEDLWELQQLMQCTTYIAELTRNFKDPLLIGQVQGAYQFAIAFATEHGHAHLAQAYTFTLAKYLMKQNNIIEAQVLLQSLSDEHKNRWEVQRVMNLCLEKRGNYKSAQAAWRACAERLPQGGESFLEAKWHVADCSLKTGDAEHAHKVAAYSLLMYPKMSQNLKRRFEHLVQRAKQAEKAD